MAILSDFSLNNFRGAVKNVVRPYLFYVQIPTFPTSPAGDGSSSTGEARRFTYLAQSTKIPERELEILKINWQGYEYKIGANSKWSSWDVDFIIDDKAESYTELRKWCDAVHDPVTNKHGDPGTGSDGYVRDGITVQQIHHKEPGTVLVEFQLIGAWPSKVSGYDLKYQVATEPAMVKVTFEYVYAKFTK